MNAAICHIVCAGPCDHLDIELEKRDLLIAADGGYAHCLAAGIDPELYIGDLDSLPRAAAAGLACERIVLPCDKDDTDTLAACKEGMKRGYAEFRIYAALGGDVGHELANMQLLAFLHRHGAHGILYGGGQQVHLVTPDASPCEFRAEPGTRVSVFAFGAKAQGVVERGLHWELEGATIHVDEPIGVSNRVESGIFEIGVAEGALIIVIG